MDPKTESISERCKSVPSQFLIPHLYYWNPVNVPDADITFRSSDGVIFRVHSKNLETHSDGFPPSTLCKSSSELVDLSEPAETLNLLFQYMYPQRQPDLNNIAFPLLADLSEAAEKYQGQIA
jgi:hypothetical protein